MLDNHSWLEEKNQLVQAHNDAKVKLITEIQTLRKMLTPTAEQHFNELRGSEFLRVALEEEVINTHIQNDNLKVKQSTLCVIFSELGSHTGDEMLAGGAGRAEGQVPRS